ncbi:MAG: hypothetical protein JOZ65_07210 [Chloroflexi bacterium]|nr:hypothetical protein [Chloroflexota bacterium]
METAGLRRQSLALIGVDDWGEFQPGRFWLCWKHDKKREEHDAVLDRGVARLLDQYKERTTAALGLTRFDGHLKTGDTCPDGVRLNGEALEAQVHQRLQS